MLMGLYNVQAIIMLIPLAYKKNNTHNSTNMSVTRGRRQLVKAHIYLYNLKRYPKM